MDENQDFENMPFNELMDTLVKDKVLEIVNDGKDTHLTDEFRGAVSLASGIIAERMLTSDKALETMEKLCDENMQMFVNSILILGVQTHYLHLFDKNTLPIPFVEKAVLVVSNWYNADEIMKKIKEKVHA